MTPTTTMHAKSYKGFGLCIYCRGEFKQNQLTDEHIIPLALNGALIIRDAACEDCRKITNEKYENLALQADLFIPRMILGLKRRKKNTVKRMPSGKIGNHTMGDGPGEVIDYTPENFPRMFSLIHFPPPGKLSNIDRGGVLQTIWFQEFNLGVKDLPAGGVTFSEMRNHTAFGLTLAKIGYCFAVAELGLHAFNADDITALLLLKRGDTYNFVGSAEVQVNSRTNSLHWLSVARVGEYIVANIRLFSSFGGGAYNVVLGKSTGGQ